MSVRIKYIDHKYKANHKISGKAYTSKSTGAKYRIILNLDEMEWYVRNERTKELVKKSSTSYTNMNVLKRTARKGLESMGVVLETESRMRTFGRCPKNYTEEQHQRKLRQEKLQDSLSNNGRDN